MSDSQSSENQSSNTQSGDNQRFGFVTIVGRPNVGKSTLMNFILGKKLSITSRKPQTTRHRILGIKTKNDIQVVYVDTPGLHMQEKKAMNRYLNRAARGSMQDVDLIVFVVDVTAWTAEDDWVLKQLSVHNVPVILAVNKIDKIPDRLALLPYIEAAVKRSDFHCVVPLSAKKGDQVLELEQQIIACLPKESHCFDPTQFTDRSDQFMATEILREKLTRMLGEELPYAITVTIDAFQEDEKLIKISAIIWVEKETQKAIVIGKNGLRLKEMASKARIDMEKYFDKKVFLESWVKIKSGWADNERALGALGYK